VATKKAPPRNKPVAWYDTPGLREHFGACATGWDDAKTRFSKFPSADDWWKKARPSVMNAEDMWWFLGATSPYIRNCRPAVIVHGAVTGYRMATKKYPTAAQQMKIMRYFYTTIPVSNRTIAAFPEVFPNIWGQDNAN
jgi:hypothetical protein